MSSSPPPQPGALEAAATRLRAGRDLLAERYAVSEGDDGGRVVAVGVETFEAWLFPSSRTWRSLLSIRRAGPQPSVDLVRSLRNNRRIVDDGLRMVSVFPTEGAPADLLDLLAGQLIPYRIGHAPLDMKIVDGEQLLLEGPLVDGQRSIMVVTDPRLLALAQQYWRLVLAGTRDAADLHAQRRSAPLGLTARQRAVIALLGQDASDPHAAEVLGISVRTLRAEVAEVKRVLGVTTRFAAGLELGRRAGLDLQLPADRPEAVSGP